MKDNEVRCVFWYGRRATRYDRNTDTVTLMVDEEGKPLYNDNFISFLQVISFFWEMQERDGTLQNILNVFLPGGSVFEDRNGNKLPRPGHTVTLNEKLGKKFVSQFWNWSRVFGLSTNTVTPTTTTGVRSTGSRGYSRNVRDDDFNDPEEEVGAVGTVTME